MTLRVSSAFDGGNAEIVEIEDSGAIRLRIRKDVGDRFFQWFCFRVSGARGVPLTITLENANEASYEQGFVDYNAVVSSDLERWTRVPSELTSEGLVIRHTGNADVLTFGYFAPFSMAQHHALLSRCASDRRVTLETLGHTLDGQPLDLVRVGTGPRPFWAIARQHPGETMAEYWMEGFLGRLLDRHDPVSRKLLEDACFYVVPNMNPDGSRRGHLRTNASGANLNREWLEPSMDRSPEVFLVRERMQETGVQLCYDVHGDEGLPYVFLAGSDGIPSLSQAQVEQLAALRASLTALTPDFQTERGYPPARPGQANLSMCTNWVAETFSCLAVTLEMPFKDAANHPLPETGWSPERSRHLGRAFVDATRALVPSIAAR
ncbi:MAG: M14-type cytosolic carboxypeptidase [Sandaracinaceae bacterium]